MEKLETGLEGLFILKPKVFHDNRGYFFESFNKKMISELIGEQDFVQDNQSLSSKGVLRGMHFQLPPHAQGKLVRVVSGSVLDVVIDIRKKSQTYGKYYAIELSAENMLQLWIPPGFAHGFESLADNTIFSYKCTNYYHKDSEDAIHPYEPLIKTVWKFKEHLIAEKDLLGSFLDNYTSVF